jgi:hypothetical protein
MLMNIIINKLILFQIKSLCRYFDNNFDKYPITKKKSKEDIEAPIPKKYLSIIRKFLEKFPKKKTVSE